MSEHYKEILKGLAENPGIFLWYGGCMIGQAEDLVVRTPMVIKLLTLAVLAGFSYSHAMSRFDVIELHIANQHAEGEKHCTKEHCTAVDKRLDKLESRHSQ